MRVYPAYISLFQTIQKDYSSWQHGQNIKSVSVLGLYIPPTKSIVGTIPFNNNKKYFYKHDDIYSFLFSIFSHS